MKIVDLKCPSCGGKLVPMEGNPKIVVCEYCNSQFVLEEDNVINYHIHQYGPGGAGGVNVPRPQSPITPLPSSDGYIPTKSGPEPLSMPKVAVVAVAALAVAAAVFISAGVMGAKKSGGGKEEPSLTTAPHYVAGEETKTDKAQASDVSLGEPSPLYEAAIKGIFGKAPELVTQQDLEKIKYISVKKGSETSTVKYSFDDPYETEGFREVSLKLDPLDWNPDDLARFPGLCKVELTYEWPGGDILKNMEHLKGISCSNMEIAEIAEKVNPKQMTELYLDGVESLEGLAAFENLEILSLEDVYAPDIRQLTPLKNLKSLYIVEDDSGDIFSTEKSATLTDYSGLSVLTGLEALHLESECVREFSFLKPLVNLKELAIEDSEAISLEPLADLPQLVSLSLIDNNEIKDYGPVGSLSNLETLVLDKSTSQDDPDLSSLGNLTSLEISGFMSVDGLKRLGNLRELSVHGCNIDEIAALSALSNLERFSCYSVWTYAKPLKNVNFIDGMTNLKYLDFCGKNSEDNWGSFQNNMEILGDISNVFTHQGLEELYVNGCMFEINFGNLRENPSLKVLEMKDVSLKENFYVQSSGGMTDIWYDDVALDGHTDFLTYFPGLEQLYLDGNQLTNISFAASLQNLTHLGINNNYVTDLAPLNQVGSLRFLDVRQNPVGSVDIGGDITVLK
ncbi:MAG: leucine-rich repeat domain-containing protein [Hungatella sp.]|nr:leucine-rich repeat domain-containing protein [Hungatella sp.]